GLRGLVSSPMNRIICWPRASSGAGCRDLGFHYRDESTVVTGRRSARARTASLAVLAEETRMSEVAAPSVVDDRPQDPQESPGLRVSPEFDAMMARLAEKAELIRR